MTDELITGPRQVEGIAEFSPLAPSLVDPGERRRRRRIPITVMLAIVWLAIVILSAIFANVLPIANPNVGVGVGIRTVPLHIASQPFGTDSFGRSILSRVIYGGRVSLAAGFGAVLIAMILGLIVGISAGYFRGKIDTVVGIVLDSLLSIPALILLIALAATLQPGIPAVVIGLALISFPAFARLARGNTLAYRSAEFVLAARGLGATAHRIIFREIFPLVLVSVTAYAGVISALLILAESSLSFLGLGVQPPNPSWGNMISDGLSNLQNSPFLVFIPMAVLFFTILSLNTLGDWLRDRSGVDSKL
jgi:peptide/nickel transport system permease protein